MKYTIALLILTFRSIRTSVEQVSDVLLSQPLPMETSVTTVLCVCTRSNMYFYGGHYLARQNTQVVKLFK